MLDEKIATLKEKDAPGWFSKQMKVITNTINEVLIKFQ